MENIQIMASANTSTLRCHHRRRYLETRRSKPVDEIIAMRTEPSFALAVTVDAENPAPPQREFFGSAANFPFVVIRARENRRSRNHLFATSSRTNKTGTMLPFVSKASLTQHSLASAERFILQRDTSRHCGYPT
jgi:hypothetical protein